MFRTILCQRALNLTLLVTFLAAAGCSQTDSISSLDSDDQSAVGAPALPAVSTMRMELDFFGIEPPVTDEASLAQGKPSDMLLTTAGGDHANWINAFVRVVFLQLTLYDNLAAPIGAFALAAHSVPQQVEPGTYLWTYIFVDKSVEYSIFLYGTPGAGIVDWRMEVSSNDPARTLAHFVWFDGQTHNDQSGGFWQFYEPITEATGSESARIDWTHGTARNTMTILINGAGAEDEGDYLTLTDSATAVNIDHYDASAALLSNINWSSDGSGSITVPDYNNGQQACWDTQQVNIVCQ